MFFLGDSRVETVAAAKLFASEKNRTVACDSFHMISPDSSEIASCLIQRRGVLSLPRLQYIKADALRILATKDDVRLPSLDSLYILDEQGRDVAPADVVSEQFLKKNAENQPPPGMPKWHSWDLLLKADAEEKASLR
jgi:hypothetical protein